jgi:hypothetical protein
MSEGGDVIMSEGGDSMPNRLRLSMLMSVSGVLESFPRVLVPRQAILFSMLLLGDTVGMRGNVV